MTTPTNGLEKYVEKKPVNSSPLGSNFSDNSVAALQTQRGQLKEFVAKCLVKDVDYGLIPGTFKDSLFKPGAEKIANLFKLGSRIVHSEKEINLEKNWAMFTHKVELFHIPTGAVVSQCEGSSNSQEKKNRSKPIADQLNPLSKMAQKRAYVGAVIIATGASDFFTQDVEDMDLGSSSHTATRVSESGAQFEFNGKPVLEMELKALADHVLAAGFNAGKRIGDLPIETIIGNVSYWRKRESRDKKPLTGGLRADVEIQETYLARVGEGKEE
jgi:hypothetical protein